MYFFLKKFEFSERFLNGFKKWLQIKLRPEKNFSVAGPFRSAVLKVNASWKSFIRVFLLLLLFQQNSQLSIFWSRNNRIYFEIFKKLTQWCARHTATYSKIWRYVVRYVNFPCFWSLRWLLRKWKNTDFLRILLTCKKVQLWVITVKVKKQF